MPVKRYANIQLRRDSAADWTSTDPVLLEGEVGLELDTGKGKIGDGATAWSGLSYVWQVPLSTHNNLNGLQGGNGADEFYHLTAAQHTTIGNLGTMAVQNADSVSITGGSIAGLTSLAVSGNITVDGTVDGLDISALNTVDVAYDNGHDHINTVHRSQ